MNAEGYVVLHLRRKSFPAHRVAWLLMTGDWPPQGMDIDHINRDRADNRWSNLRLATRSQNKNNSIYIGVTKNVFPDGRVKWRARRVIDGKRVHLGNFDTFAEAREAYLERHTEHSVAV